MTITGPEGETYPVLQLEESGTLQFSIEPGVATYRVQITESMIDVLSFDLSERESELCCGQQTFSTATQLNGQEIDNSDLITIIQ